MRRPRLRRPRIRDILGRRLDVLYVKGSGWDATGTGFDAPTPTRATAV